ncbi:hypothetical protein LCGC14_2380120 [marine sediment metagenome]|uniref:Helix-turn-helix domain-containing protein n=1 Tax=marine sediment metagenome TaxID=412755 RepID=A0A0F9EDL3_9ZZZZ
MDKENVIKQREEGENASTWDPRAYLSPDEVATECRVAVQTVYGWLNSEKLQGKRLGGGVWRITRRALDEFRGEVNLFDPAQTEGQGE